MLTADELATLRRTQDKMKNYGMEGVDGAADGIHMEVQCPSTLRGVLWAPWEKIFAVCAIVFVDLSGRILYLSPLQRRNNEQHIINDIDLRDLLRSRGMGVVSDAKLCWNTKDTKEEEYIHNWFTVGPLTLKKLRDNCDLVGAWGYLGAFCRRWLRNTKLGSQVRIVVENAIGRARQFKVISHPYRAYHAEDGRYTANLGDVMRIVFTLTNRLIDETPCRADDWMPEARRTFDSGAGDDKKMYDNVEGFRNPAQMEKYLSAELKRMKEWEAKGNKIERIDTLVEEEERVAQLESVIDSKTSYIEMAEEEVDEDELLQWRQRVQDVHARRMEHHFAMFHDASDALDVAEERHKKYKRR